MSREYLVVYHSYLADLESYSDAEFGRLIRAALRYSIDGTETEFKRKERHVWSMLRGNVERNKQHYEEVSRRRSEAAKKRYAQEEAKKGSAQEELPERTPEGALLSIPTPEELRERLLRH